MSVVVTCDLRSHFGPARDQGSRPTCLVFAASDIHSVCHSPLQLLSPEYLYYHAIRRAGAQPGCGARLDHLLTAVETDGQPKEVGWPYLPVLPADLTKWRPPGDVGELKFGRGAIRAKKNISQICHLLDHHHLVMVILTISNAFYCPDKDGVVDSTEAVDITRRHAVVAAGYGSRNTQHLILCRNSWGVSWGQGGYAWVAESYLSLRLLNLVTITKVP